MTEQDWVYSLLPQWAEVVPHWVLAVAVVGLIAALAAAWRYWAGRVAAAAARASEAEESTNSVIRKRVERLSDHYDSLDSRIDEGFTALHGTILATEQRHSDRLAEALTAIRIQQHQDHQDTHRTVSTLVEGMRNEVQRFTSSQQKGLIEVTAGHQQHAVKIEMLEARADKVEKRLVALETEQRSQAQAINGRRTVTDYLNQGDAHHES